MRHPRRFSAPIPPGPTLAEVCADFEPLRLVSKVWETAAGDAGLGWPGAHAVADAAFAAACGDLLDADEVRLSTKPWSDLIAV